MRISYLSLALLGLAFSTLSGPAGATPGRPTLAVARTGCSVEQVQSIHWQKSLAAAKGQAARTGKPLFLLHLFGKLDEAFC